MNILLYVRGNACASDVSKLQRASTRNPLDVDHLDLSENDIRHLTELQRFRALQSLNLSFNALGTHA